jgi:endonuclease/exonuclease/phosphatase family metal-dependent hydrolase
MSSRSARLASDLVVMTQNAWGGAPLWSERERRLAGILGERRPAVVGLNEIHAASPSGDESQAHALARRAGGYRAFFWAGQVGADGHAEGNAVLCRDDVEVIDRASSPLSLDDGDPLDRVARRVVTRTTLCLAGTIVDVIVTHLPISKGARLRTVREVLAFAEEGRRASGSAGAVLMGDLNAAPAEAPIRLLAERWTDAWDHVHPGARGGTWPSLSPLVRIDYVFVQPGEGWSIVSCDRAPFSASDHRGLVATIGMPGVVV